MIDAIYENKTVSGERDQALDWGIYFLLHHVRVLAISKERQLEDTGGHTRQFTREAPKSCALLQARGKTYIMAIKERVGDIRIRSPYMYSSIT